VNVLLVCANACVHYIFLYVYDIWLWRNVLFVQESVCFNKVKVKEFCAKQSLLCTSLNKAYVMALKFSFKCVHLMDKRNGIDGTDY